MREEGGRGGRREGGGRGEGNLYVIMVSRQSPHHTLSIGMRATMKEILGQLMKTNPEVTKTSCSI